VIEGRPRRGPTSRRCQRRRARLGPPARALDRVIVDFRRPEVRRRGPVLVDATSGAGGLRSRRQPVRPYYFAPQKASAADGGLLARRAQPGPRIGDLVTRRSNVRCHPLSSRCRRARELAQEPDYNTPAVGDPAAAASPTRSSDVAGRGLDWCVHRTLRPPAPLRLGPGKHFSTPFVPTGRSLAGGRPDRLGRLPSNAAVLAREPACQRQSSREPYRKLGAPAPPRYFFFGWFPRSEPADVEHSTSCVDCDRERVLGDAVKVLVKEKIADSGVDLLREKSLHVDLGPRNVRTTSCAKAIAPTRDPAWSARSTR